VLHEMLPKDTCVNNPNYDSLAELAIGENVAVAL
jgi:hypothetical protein